MKNREFNLFRIYMKIENDADLDLSRNLNRFRHYLI